LKEFFNKEIMRQSSSIVLFHNQQVRRLWDDEKEDWYFSVIDLIAILTDSSAPKRYWSDLKIKLKKEEKSEVYDKIVRLKMIASDGKKRETDSLSTEDLLRLVQSIPSPKAEPLKLWLARVGKERIDETYDPEKAIDRALLTYLKKGYSKEWINQRLKAIEVRKELTAEWEKRGVEEGIEYAILTDEITKAWTGGMTTKDYKKFKGLQKESLRDNMNTLEVVLNMLGEATTTEISKHKNPKTFYQNKKVAREGGQVAGNARQDIEKRTGKKVITNKSTKRLKKSK
jgi:prophage antirepressor-like protein